MIGIVDYGAGNLMSVKKAFDFLRVKNKILSKPDELDTINRLVLPGVGSFGHAVAIMRETNFYDPIKEWVTANQPFLGICLGLQLLFESSQEAECIAGFSFFKGKCRRFLEKKVPQIGWNNIQIERNNSLFDGMTSGEYFYFVHSYYVVPEEADVILAESNYGLNYTSVAGRGNVYGVQFHPEKSGPAGLKLLKNWVEQCWQ